MSIPKINYSSSKLLLRFSNTLSCICYFFKRILSDYFHSNEGEKQNMLTLSKKGNSSHLFTIDGKARQYIANKCAD